MVIDKELLTYILDYYPGWGNSPEAFLEFITVTIQLSRQHAADNGYEVLGLTGSEQELADIFLRVFPVDLRPYESFAHLQSEVVLKIDIEKIVEEMRAQSQQEDEFYGLLEETGVQPDLETMVDGLLDASLTEKIIRELEPYLHFR